MSLVNKSKKTKNLKVKTKSKNKLKKKMSGDKFANKKDQKNAKKYWKIKKMHFKTWDSALNWSHICILPLWYLSTLRKRKMTIQKDNLKMELLCVPSMAATNPFLLVLKWLILTENLSTLILQKSKFYKNFIKKNYKSLPLGKTIFRKENKI